MGEEESSVVVDVDAPTAEEADPKGAEEVEDKRKEVYVEDAKEEDRE